MAAADKLWFELGVRDEVSGVLETLMKTSEKLGDALTDDSAELKNYYRNIVDISNVYDKIHVTQKRIAGLKGLSLTGDQRKGLKAMSDDIEKARKEMAAIFKDPTRLLERGEVQFDKMRLNIELMLKDSLRYIDGIEEKDRAEAKNAANESKRIEDLKSKYYELQQYRKQLSDAIVNAAPGSNLVDATSIINGISSRMSAVKRAERNGGGMPASASGADYENFLRRVKAELSSLTGATDDYNNKLQTNKNIQAALNKLYLDTESQHKIAAIRGQVHEYAALSQKMQEITQLLAAVRAEESSIANGNITPTYTKDKVDEQLNAIQRHYNESLARGKQMEIDDALAKEKKAASTRKAMEAVSMLAHVNEGLVSSYSRIAEAGSNANRITVQLQQQIGAYAGLYGLERILKSVITIGGQFEVQHVALRNILGDIQDANVLFGQLQGLAVESPKTFQELTAYAKQLSAYQIPANELYDTTKRLADMSSGLGVDMNRLILAYGQVRSAAVLRGQELRQFTEAGIPMVQALADKFTQMNGKLTTTADVFALISKRAVPFEMVKEVLWDMTNQGGQFYNMQSELADTLFGKWQKLQDQWQITLGHIADGTNATGKALKWVLELAVSLASAFDTISPMLSGFAVGRLGTKMAQSAKEAFERRNGTTAITTMTLAKQKEAARLDRERVMYGRQLNQQEQQLINRKNVLTANELKLLLAEEKITEKQIVQLANAGKLNRLEMLKLLYAQGYTKQQIQQIVNGNLQILQQKQSSMLSNLKNGIMGFVGGWPGLIMTGIGAIWSLYSYIEDKNEELSQKGEAMMSHAQQGANSLAKALSSVEADGSTEKKIEVLEEALLQLGSTGEAIVAKSREHMDDIGKRWEVLKSGADDYQKTLASMGNQEGKALFEEGIDSSGIEDSIKKYDDALNESFKTRSLIMRYSETYKKAIDSIIGDNDRLKASLNGKNLFEQIEAIGQKKIYNELYVNRNNSYGGLSAPAISALNSYFNKLIAVENKWNDISRNSIPEMETALKALAEGRGITDFENLTPQQKQSLETLTREYVKAIQEGSTEAKNKLAEELASQVFHIKIVGDLSIDKTKMSGFASYVWQKFGGAVAGDNGKISVGKQSFTKAQVSNIFGDIGNFAKEYNSEWKKQTELAAKYHKAGAEQLENEAKQEAASIKSTLDALDLFDSGKSGSGGGSKKDAELDRVKNRVDLYKKFWSELENARKIYGQKGGLDFLKENGFAEVFGMKLTDVTNYRQSLNELTKGLASTSEARKKFLNSVDADIVVQKRKEETESIKEYVSELQRMMSVMSENYQTYKKWVDLTGDTELAARVAGVTQNTTYADYLKELMQKELNKTNLALTPDDVFGLDKDGIKQLGENNAFNTLWDEWRKNQQKLKKDQLDLYEDAIKNSKTYEDKIADVNRKLKEQIEAVEKLAKDDAQRERLTNNLTQNASREISKINWEKFKDENNWGEVFGDLENLPLKQLKKMIKAMREFSKTANLNTTETKAWHEAMTKLTDREAVIDPLETIGDALKNLDVAQRRSASLEGMREGVRRGYHRDLYSSEEELQKAIELSRKAEDKALADLRKAIKALAGNISKLGSSFDSLGNSIGGKLGDVFNGFGTIFGGFGKSIDAISSVDINAKGIAGIAGKASAVASVFSAMIDMNTKLHGLLPSTESLYEHYAEKQREINKAREAIDEYAVAVIKRAQKERDWLYSNDLTAIRNGGYLQGKLLENYANTVLAPQEIYQEARSGLSKWAGAIIGAVAGAVITIVTWGAGGPLGVAAGTAIANVIGGVAATAVGAAVASGAGAALGQAMQSAAESILYKEGQTSARANMRVQTRHASFWRGEKTQNLEEWVREEYGKELFGKDFHGYDLIDLDIAKSILERDITLAGETRETLERLVEITEQIEEIQDQTHSYVSEKFSPLVDNMTDSLWDWLSDGKNMMDSFHEYASDTFADIAKDAIKAFLKINLMDKFSGKLNDMFEAYSFGLLNEQALMLGVANVAGEIGTTFETLSPVLQELGTVLAEAFKIEGYDIVNGAKGSSSSTGSSIKSVSETTADLLASYINAIRADVSVDRSMIALYYPQFLNAMSQNNTIANAQLEQLRMVVQNTNRNAEAAEMIYEILHSSQTGARRLEVKLYGGM